jgi:hypothetical protein
VALIARAAALWVLVAVGTATAAHAQDVGRAFTVRPSRDSANVGDTIRITFRLTTHERDLLTDTFPRPIAELPPGVRVAGIQRLRRDHARVFVGEALVAFYRPGRQEIPAFGVPWVQIVTGHRGTVATEPATVEIVPVIPGGNPSLKDIREPEALPGPGVLPLVIGGAALALLAAALLRRRRRPSEPELQAAPAVPAAPPDPYHAALARLDALERARGFERGDIDEHYAGVTDALRDYLEAAHDIPARERTSSELLWTLPPRLTEGGLRRLAAELLEEADLVKFARGRPATEAALAHLTAARELLCRWHEAGASSPAESEADAVR